MVDLSARISRLIAGIERFRLPEISEFRPSRGPPSLEVALACIVLRYLIEMNRFSLIPPRDYNNTAQNVYIRPAAYPPPNQRVGITNQDRTC
jgi:hypothetical protein